MGGELCWKLKHRIAVASSIIILLFVGLFGTYLMGSNGSDNVLLL